ncbi:MAG: M48 family metalloprotease [Deltaproteobacteria bacterium]|nr:M48 family metalloprotease [Deltaproteobacteria bacterium]
MRLPRLTVIISCLAFSFLVLLPVPGQALTHQEERELGQEIFNLLQEKLTLTDDPDLKAYINGLGQKILKGIGPQPFDYRFFVVHSENINAFAVPAGYVFIHSGLITSYESEGQLAATLAHEIAHVTARHVAKWISQSKKLTLATMGGILAGIFIGGPVGQAVALGSMAGSIQTQLKYSREDETEADQKGLEYLVKAGYNPKYLAESFHILLRAQYSGPNDIPSYLQTHPGLLDRISSVEIMVAAHPSYKSTKGGGDDQAFTAFKSKIMARYANELQAYNYFQNLLKDDRTTALGHYGLALLYEKQQKTDLAAGQFRLAVGKEVDNTEILSDFGGLLFRMGDYPEALKYLHPAFILKPRSVRTLFYLSRIFQEQGHLEQSREFFERLLLEDPENELGRYNLGLVYGRLGDLARAHFNTGLYFKMTGKHSQALYHLEKARGHAVEKSSGLVERIDEILTELKKKPGNRPGKRNDP